MSWTGVLRILILLAVIFLEEGELAAVMVAAGSFLQIDEASTSIKPSSPLMLPLPPLHGSQGGMVLLSSNPSQGGSLDCNSGIDNAILDTRRAEEAERLPSSSGLLGSGSGRLISNSAGPVGAVTELVLSVEAERSGGAYAGVDGGGGGSKSFPPDRAVAAQGGLLWAVLGLELLHPRSVPSFLGDLLAVGGGDGITADFNESLGVGHVACVASTRGFHRTIARAPETSVTWWALPAVTWGPHRRRATHAGVRAVPHRPLLVTSSIQLN